jgi:hypothetical protein
MFFNFDPVLIPAFPLPDFLSEFGRFVGELPFLNFITGTAAYRRLDALPLRSFWQRFLAQNWMRFVRLTRFESTISDNLKSYGGQTLAATFRPRLCNSQYQNG